MGATLLLTFHVLLGLISGQFTLYNFKCQYVISSLTDELAKPCMAHISRGLPIAVLQGIEPTPDFEF